MNLEKKILQNLCNIILWKILRRNVAPKTIRTIMIDCYLGFYVVGITIVICDMRSEDFTKENCRVGKLWKLH